MKMSGKTKIILKILAGYCALWLLTATWGEHDVDCDFDRQFSVGDAGSPLGGPIKPTPVVRLEELPNHKSHFTMEEAGKLDVPEYPWRFRSQGVAIAPFVIVDEVALYLGGMEAHSWRRLSFWFLGYTKWKVIKQYVC